MIRLIIEGNTIRFDGMPDGPAYLVVRENGLQISREKIESILPVERFDLDGGEADVPELSGKLKELGYGDGEVLVKTGDRSWVCTV